METVANFLSLGSQIIEDSDWTHEIKGNLLLGRTAMANLDNILKSRDITSSIIVYIVKAIVFSSSHVYIWELSHKEGWALRNWSFWTVVVGKTLESPLDSKEIKPVNIKGNQPWIFIARTDAESEAPILWPPDGKSQLIGKVSAAGKDWGQKEKRVSDEMLGWPCQCGGYELRQISGNGGQQGGLVWCSPWSCELDTTRWLNNNISSIFMKDYCSAVFFFWGIAFVFGYQGSTCHIKWVGKYPIIFYFSELLKFWCSLNR